MSCERGRRSAYSNDLRWRIVWQRVALELDVKTISANLGIDASTVCRIVKKFNETGDVCKKKYPKDCRMKQLTKAIELIVLNLVINKPGIFLREIKEELSHVYGAEVHESTLCMHVFKEKWIYEAENEGCGS